MIAGTTRKARGRKHNINLHSGTATIVRSIDYIIGRISGHYLPSDPLLYRNKKKKSIPIFLVITMTMDPALRS